MQANIYPGPRAFSWFFPAWESPEVAGKKIFLSCRFATRIRRFAALSHKEKSRAGKKPEHNTILNCWYWLDYIWLKRAKRTPSAQWQGRRTGMKTKS